LANGCTTSSKKPVTPTDTATPDHAAVPTVTLPPSYTKSASPTESRTTTPTPTVTPTRTQSLSQTVTASPTSSSTPTQTPTLTAIGYLGVLHPMGGNSYVAPILPGGNLGSWSLATPIPTIVGNPAVAADGSYVYVAGGGLGGTNYTSTVYSGALGSGWIGAWTSTGQLPAPVWLAGGVVVGNYLFVVGGSDSANQPVSSVLSAPISSPGVLGTWSTTLPLPVEVTWVRCVSDGNQLLVHGSDQSATTSTVYVGTVSGGAITAWAQASPIPTPAWNDAMGFAGGALFHLGGWTPGTTTVYHSEVHANVLSAGNLTTWSNVTPLPGPRAALAAAVGPGGWIYAIGGVGSVPESTVYYALASGGAIGSWLTTTAMPVPLNELEAFVW